MKDCEKCTLRYSSYCPNERGEPCYGFAETADNADLKVEPKMVNTELKMVNTEPEEVRTVTYDELTGFLGEVLAGDISEIDQEVIDLLIKAYVKCVRKL